MRMFIVPSASKIACVAKGEVRTARRQVRFWTVVFLLSLFCLVGYGLSCSFFAYAATTSPSYGPGIPKYLLGNIDPSFFLMFQMAALFLLFDATHQHNRDRIAEVLDTKPITNFEYLAGRVLGIAGLLWIVAVLNVLVMQVFGWVAKTTSIAVGDTLQLHSMVNLVFLDAPTTLLLWCSVVVLLSNLLHVRVLVVAVSLGLMFASLFLVLETPYSLLAIASPSSNDSLFVSELLPQFASTSVVAIRAGTILIALALVAAGTALLRRKDRQTKVNTVLSLAAVGVGVTFLALGSWSHVAHYDAANQWQVAHHSYSWDQETDLTAITGSVQITRSRLAVDMYVTVQHASSPSNLLVFSFNPSMDIETLELDGRAAKYSFENGLLEVESPNAQALERQRTLHIVAQGIPDQRFAYFDSAFDYVREPKVSLQAIALLGEHGSVYDSKYVALMPAVHWYPTPGPIRNDYASTQRGSDYFDVDLSVQLSDKDWHLVAHGATKQGNQPNSYRVSPADPVHEMGLFATNFESASIDIGGITFDMHLHEKHKRNLQLLQDLEAAVVDQASQWLERYSGYGLPLPKTVSLVEVPRNLRTVGGGWRMNSLQNMPGIVLLKEHGFPTTRLDLVLDRHVSEGQRPVEELFGWFENYFSNGIGPDSPLFGLALQSWVHANSASGPHATALDTIVQNLISSLSDEEPLLFNIYSTLHFADTTAISLFEGTEGSVASISNDYLSNIPTIARLRQQYTTRTSVWNDLETTGFSDLPSSHGHQRDIELYLLKCREIASALISINGEDSTFRWLVGVLRKYRGRNYTLADLIAIADEHEVSVNPTLTSWLGAASLPGYSASPYTTFRIQDDQRGNPQYQTSVSVRNTRDVAGVVNLEYPTEQTWNWTHPYLDDSEAVRIAGNSTKRINLLTSYEVRSVYVNPRLSLNRSRIGLTKASSRSVEHVNLAPAPFEADDSWNPRIEEGIVVDDLDPSFNVSQTPPRMGRPSRVGIVAWVRLPQLAGEMDRGLPIGGRYLFEWHTPRGVWIRNSEPRAYGEYRRTSALVWVREASPQAVFTAEISESTQWQLEYHAPVSLSDRWYRGLKYKLLVANGTESTNIELHADTWKVGWNVVGEFGLDKGAVRVELLGTSQPGPLYADAIRWTKVEEN